MPAMANDDLACPKCGKPITSDPWEYTEGDHETECGWCDAPVTLRVMVSVRYEVKTREARDD